MEREGQRESLFITINRYKDTVLTKLVPQTRENIDPVKVLENRDIGFFDKVEKLKNVSSSRICESLEHHIRHCKDTDTFLFSYSGHGIIDEHGKLYLAAKNTRLNALRSTAVPLSFLIELMEECHGGEKIFIIDCAFISMARKGVTQKQVSPGDCFGCIEGKGLAVISSSRITEYPFYSEKRISLNEDVYFMHHIVEGLETGNADIDGDGFVTVGELYRYIIKKMEADTCGQLPVLWLSDQKDDIVIAKNPRGRTVRREKEEDEKNLEQDNDAPSSPAITSTIAKQGWKSVKPGREYAFFFLYIALHQPSVIREKNQDCINRETSCFLSYISHWIRGAGGKLWVHKKENNEYIYLFPYTENNIKKIFQCAFRILLYKSIYDFEHSAIQDLLSFRLGLHLDAARYEPDPENKILASSAVNFCFHFGEKLEPEYLYVTRDVRALMPQHYHRFLFPSGNMESQDLYRLGLSYIKETII
ncbi:MAG: caspase family protein [Spirochaetales bacterium]|nr:caspase family protein [Spirochaetales bacterium]